MAQKTITADFNPVNAEELVDLAIVHMIGRRNLLILGEPGIGKTEIASTGIVAAWRDYLRNRLGEDVPVSLGVNGRPVVPASLDTLDWRGLPHEKDGRTTWSPPVFLPTDADVEAGRVTEYGILLIDEINQASPTTLAPLHGLLHGGYIGEATLAKNWRIIATGNRMSDGAMAQRMASSLMDRFGVCTLQKSFEVWKRGYAVPKRVRPEILAFGERKGDSMFAFNRDAEVNATPRSWAALSATMDAAQRLDQAAIIPKLAIANIGEAMGKEFAGYLRTIQSLPKPSEIYSDPKGCKMPTDKPDVLMMLAHMLAIRANDGNIEPSCVYVGRMTPEVQASYLKVLEHESKDLMEHPAVKEMLKKHPYLLELQ